MSKELDFINKVAPIVQNVFNSNSCALPSVVIAQCILESGYGSSFLAQYNNILGLNNYHDGYLLPTAGSVFLDVPQERNGQIVYGKEEMATFPNYNDCIASLKLWYTRPKYNDLPKVREVAYQANFLTGKYATDSGYGAKLIDIVNRYNLTQYDAIEPTPEKDESHIYFVQFGAYGSVDGASSRVRELISQGVTTPLLIIYSIGYYKTIGYLSYDEAETKKHYEAIKDKTTCFVNRI